jgi:outer membrane immunogenic protein
MKKLTLALTAATALVSAPSLAADLGRAPVAPARAPVIAPAPFHNWSGFYIGIQGGGAWGELEHTLVTTGTTFRHDTTGGLLGGTVGFNWQSGAWVFGFEADYAWADIGRSITCFEAIVPGLRCGSSLESFGTARLRLGGGWDRVLLYGTGGLAFGDQAIFIEDTVTGERRSRSRFAVGWTIGGGLEWAFYPGWSFKAEALYFDIEPERLSTGGTLLGALLAEPVGIDSRHTGVIVRGGINYRFNWGGPVVANY